MSFVEVYEAIEERLTDTDDNLELNLLDQLAFPEVGPQQQAHQGVAIRRVRTEDRDLTRHRDELYVQDDVIVELAWRLEPKSQRDSAKSAWRKAEAIRGRLVDYSWAVRDWDVRYVRSIDRHVGEWLLISIQFRFTRLTSVYQGVGIAV